MFRATLASLEASSQAFVRIQRPAIVNIGRVAEIRSDAHGDFNVNLAGGKVPRMTNLAESVIGG